MITFSHLIAYIRVVKFYKPLTIVLTIFFSLVWLINGLYCKVLQAVPRHELIVSEILGSDYAPRMTKAIGLGEIFIALWILSGFRSRHCAIFQMVMVGVMNVIEFVMVPDLLLFGRLNILFASFFMAIIYVNEFVIRTKTPRYRMNS
jgi:hypothetical protein